MPIPEMQKNSNHNGNLLYFFPLKRNTSSDNHWICSSISCTAILQLFQTCIFYLSIWCIPVVRCGSKIVNYGPWHLSISGFFSNILVGLNTNPTKFPLDPLNFCQIPFSLWSPRQENLEKPKWNYATDHYFDCGVGTSRFL